MRCHVAVGLLCSLALVVAPSVTAAAEDIFLAIPGLDGESADAQFAGSIEALSVSGGVTAETTGAGAGAAAGKATFAPVVVKLRRTTAASVGLQDAVATGQRFPQAVLSFRRTAAQGGAVYLTITLTDAGVTSFQRTASAADDAPSETVSLTYARIKTDYLRQNPDGSAAPAVSACWDVRTNARCQ